MQYATLLPESEDDLKRVLIVLNCYTGKKEYMVFSLELVLMYQYSKVFRFKYLDFEPPKDERKDFLASRKKIKI